MLHIDLGKQTTLTIHTGISMAVLYMVTDKKYLK